VGSTIWRTPRGRQQGGLGQGLHQQAGAAGVVEVDVGGDDVVDHLGRQAQRIERGQQARHGVVGAGVDKQRAAAFDHQIGRIKLRPVKARVYGVDAVGQGLNKGQVHGSRRADEKRAEALPPLPLPLWPSLAQPPMVLA
jgi:hypothetical protein